jgi:putative acetyltransferase
MDALKLDFRRVAPDDPAVSALIARHAAHGDAHYPSESNHHMDGAAMAADGVVLFGGLLNGRAVAMGGYKIIAPGHGEVKSMHVTDEARGQGAGARLLEMILSDARAAGLTRLSLETGSLEGSSAARRLYERSGFVYCPPFGSYEEDPMSVFMTRAL